VTLVAPDLTKEQQTGQAYYVARVALKAMAGNHASGAAARGLEGEPGTEPAPASSTAKAEPPANFILLPGMPAEVHIRTGERTALSYFLKSLKDQVARALTER
jgi:HlyD family secretion protein